MELDDERTVTREQATVFAALADPTRLRLLKLLSRQRNPEAVCVNALACMLGVSQSATSQHLRVLRSIRLVRAERKGYRVHYSVNWETLEYCRSLVMAALAADTLTEGKKECNNSCPAKRTRKER